MSPSEIYGVAALLVLAVLLLRRPESREILAGVTGGHAEDVNLLNEAKNFMSRGDRAEAERARAENEALKARLDALEARQER